MIGSFYMQQSEAIENKVIHSIETNNKMEKAYTIRELIVDVNSCLFGSKVYINLNINGHDRYVSSSSLISIQYEEILNKHIARVDFCNLSYKDQSCDLFILCVYDAIALMMETNSKPYKKKSYIVRSFKAKSDMKIDTLEGIMQAKKGDYIIEGVNGEYYPCKPDIFKKTYRSLNKFEQCIYKTFKNRKEKKK